MFYFETESDIVPLDSDPHDQSKKLLTMSKSRVTPARLGINALPLERAGNTMTKRNSADNNDEMSDNDTISLSDRSLRGGGHNEVILSSDEDFVPKSQKSTPSGTTRNELSTAGASPQTPRHGRTLSSSHTSPIRFLLGGSTSAVPLSRPQRLKSFTPTKKSRRKLSFSATPDSTSDEDVDIVPRTARKEPGKSASVTVLSEDSDEVLAITPKRKRQAKLAVKLSYSGDPPNSENDLQEDLEDLQETGEFMLCLVGFVLIALQCAISYSYNDLETFCLVSGFSSPSKNLKSISLTSNCRGPKESDKG